MLSNLIAQSLIFLPLVFNNGAAANQPVVIGDGPDEPKQIVRYEAEQINVSSDGSFTLVADGNMYGGCLVTVSWSGGYPEGAVPSDCSQSTGATPDVQLFEDGSAIWTVNDETEITGCFLPDWGCSE